jgi:ABC-type lipoprotein export system ATPase subunit
VRNLDVGLIFQSFNLIADMTVFENVEFRWRCADSRSPIASRVWAQPSSA